MTESKEKRDQEEAQAAAAEVESVKGLMRLVTNAARVFHSYPPNNQLYLSFADQLGEKFLDHLEKHEALVVSVGQYEFLFKGEEVYSETNVSRSLALKLYRDGVRRIRFLPGLDKEEIVGFVRILSMPVAADSFEDDIVTLLWEEDFSHIKYAVLEEIGGGAGPPGAEKEAGEGTTGARVPTGEAAAAGAERAPAARVAMPPQGGAPEMPGFKGEYKNVRPELQKITDQIKENVASLTEDKLQQLQQHIEQEAGADVAARAAVILCDTAIMEKDPEVTATTVMLMGQIMRAHIGEGRLASATEIVARLKKIAAPEVELSAAEKNLVQQEIEKLAELEVLHQLAAVANENLPERHQQLQRFLVAWGEEGIVPVVALAGMVMDDRTVVEALREMGKGHAHSFLRGLRDPNPAAVSVALRMLADVGDASITSQLRRPLLQSNADIRLEAIRTLEKLGGEGVLELLALVLNDQDPRVRRAAAQALGSFPGTRAVGLLEQITSEKSFINKPLDEKRVLFAALASAGGAGVVPMLAVVLKKGRWFRAAKHNETRACAAYALGLIGTPEATAALERFRDSGPAIVRSACRTALSRIVSSTKEEAGNE